ncbi:MAG TPA: hypothetical protein DD733_04830 [Clostridiales bacterium]|nr:hypothetical protein [Clostridiales bacterium]
MKINKQLFVVKSTAGCYLVKVFIYDKVLCSEPKQLWAFFMNIKVGIPMSKIKLRPKAKDIKALNRTKDISRHMKMLSLNPKTNQKKRSGHSTIPYKPI